MFKSKIQNPKSKTNPESQKLKHLICYLLFVISMSGCATLWEGAKGIVGVPTKVLEDNRKFALTQTFNYDYFTGYTTTLDILKRMDTYIYLENIKKRMIAIYVSQEDTTPVGLFFKEIDATHTQIEVSSPSTYAKEFIAGKVFAVLDKTMTLDELKEQVDAQKRKQKQMGNK